MNEDDIGKVFLLALKWDWTFVGRFMGFKGSLIVLHQAGYFSRPGTTFDVLCKTGFVTSGDRKTQFHPSQAPDGLVEVANDINVKWLWEAPWPQPGGGHR